MVVLDKKLLERLTSRKVPLEELEDMEKRCFCLLLHIKMPLIWGLT